MPSDVTLRHVTFPCGDIHLEGVLHVPAGLGPRPAAVVCHPHPLYGGDMWNNVVTAICDALVADGMVSLRFNFRGVGESGGSYGAGQSERDDVRAALAFLASQPEVDATRLCLAGYSFGALVALQTDFTPLSALAAVSPPLGGDALSRLGLRCPTLFVFGGRDGVAPAANLERLGARLPEGSKVVVVPEADHFWWGLEARAASEVATFCAERTRAG